MINDFSLLARWLWDFNLVFSVQLLLILALRRPVLYWVGPLPAYRLWLLPLISLPFLWLQRSSASLSALSDRIGDALTGPSGLISISMNQEYLPALDLGGVLSLAESKVDVFPWLTLAIAVWAIVAVVLIVLMLLGMQRLAGRIRRNSRVPASAFLAVLPLEELFGRKLHVRLVKGMSSPALFGVCRPSLLLPEDFLQRYTSEQQRLIMSHEAVHLQRGDNLQNLSLCVLRLLLWWNPLVHLAWCRYRLDQELSCDAWALARSAGQQQLYAQTLLESLSERTMHQHLQPTLSAWGHLCELRERTRMINNNARHNTRRGSGIAAVFVCMLLGGASTAMFAELLPAAKLFQVEIASPDVLPSNMQNIDSMVAEAKDGVGELIEETGQRAISATTELALEPERTTSLYREVDQPEVEPSYAPAGLENEASMDDEHILSSKLVAQLSEPDDADLMQSSVDGAVGALLAALPRDVYSPDESRHEQKPRNLKPISLVRPEYPRRGLQRGVEGFAIVEFRVTETGEVENLSVHSSEPGDFFDRSAMDAASVLRFDPVLQGGRATAVEGVRYKFSYKLVDDGPWVHH